MLTVQVPLMVCAGEQLSLHSAEKVHVPAPVGVPEIVAPEDVQAKLSPLHEEGEQLVLEIGD
jgi:hypothetical protein